MLITIAVVLFTGTAIVACKSSKHSIKRLPGIWQVQPITVDGSNKDWPAPYPEYDDKAMLGYAVSNDKDNLYITVETGDPATQLKIIREGLTVWIDKTGKKDEVTAINYPIPIPYNYDRKSGSRQGDDRRPAPMHAQDGADNSSNGGGVDRRRMELEDLVHKALEDAKQYSLQGFKSCNLQYPVMEKDSCGIVVRMAIDEDGELVWEAVVPFRSFYYKVQVSRSDKGKPMSICFETTAMKRPAGESSGGRSGGGGGMRPGIGIGMGGMGMSMGGGGMRGGRGGQGADNTMTESMYKSTKTYKVFGIAYEEVK